MANPVEILEPILQQEAHEAERRLGETIGRLYCELRDRGAFSGSTPVLLTKTEYEKNIEHRRDTFLSRVKQTVSGMSSEQRRGSAPAINDLARQWLGPHITHLQEELQNLATRLHFHDSQMLDLGLDRVFKAIDAQLHIILSSQPVKLSIRGGAFVDPERLSQLKSIKSTQYDFSRLIRLCEELDIAYTQECYHATAMLTRSIIDHIPPIFNVKSFAEVASNYAGGRSFKEMAQHLQNSSRKVADAHLHTQIRAKESLPNQTQVDVRQAFDVVLAEVIRVLIPKP